MLRSRIRFAQYCDSICQSLADLFNETVVMNDIVLIPANLSGNKNHPALRGDAVRIAFRPGPTRWL